MGNTAAANTQLRTERAHITGVYSLAGRNLQQLPAELLQKLSGPSTLAPLLKSLDLSGNRLEQLPKEMGALTQLRRLNLSRNRLAVVSDAEAETVWQAWRKLEVLDLRENRLTSMANATFAFHQSLTTLQLAHNRLTTIPDSIAQLTALLVLDLSYNQISVIPASIITALHATLESLNFAHNSIVEVPVELATLTRLTTLQLDSNRVVKFPGAILRDTRVVTVSLAGNPITTRQFMAVDGYDQYEHRRKGRVDQLLKTNT